MTGKTIFKLLLIITIFALRAMPTVLAEQGDTLDNPIIITDAAGLNNIRNGLSKHYKLGNDIDLTEYLESGAGYAAWSSSGWLPIGSSSVDSYSFRGSLDGAGHKITGLWTDRAISGAALFGFVNGATIKNIGIEVAPKGIKGRHYTASLVGYCSNGSRIDNAYAVITTLDCTGYSTGGLVGVISSSRITNSHVTGSTTGSVTGYAQVGGLVGYSKNGSITDSHATVSTSGSNLNTGGLAGQISDNSSITFSYATGTVDGIASVGGLVGNSSKSNIADCYSTGEVFGSASDVGGLVGVFSEGDIYNSYATGNVVGSRQAGGLVGYISSANLIHAYAIGAVTTDGLSTGGLVGVAYNSQITRSFATGDVIGGNSSTGGLVGYNDWGSSITNCYATGSVTGGRFFGGLVGMNYDASSIATSYSTGLINSESSTEGGLIGHNTGTLINNYYDKETSGQTIGIGNNTGTGAIGKVGAKTTAEMKQQATYLPSGTEAGQWDFTNVWTITENETYPQLRTPKLTSLLTLEVTPDSPIVYPDEATLTARLSKTDVVAGRTVIFNINGTDYTTETDINGVVIFTLYEIGTYTCKARFDGDEINNPATTIEITEYIIKKAFPPSAPPAPTLSSKSTTSITLNGIPGTEYRKGTESEWQSSPVFDGLIQNTTYEFYARIAETDTREASQASEPLTVTTDSDTLIVTIITGDGGEALGGGAYNHGEEITLTATADIGYSFAGWYQDGVHVSDDETLYITVLNDCTYEARFTPNQYTITATAGTGGTVSGDGTYEHGQEVTLTAVPDFGYNFDGWYQDDIHISGDDTYYFTALDDCTFEARFTLNQYTITATAGIGGTVSGGGVHEHGKSVILTAKSDIGYSFDGWYEEGIKVSEDAEYSFTAKCSLTLEARFTHLGAGVGEEILILNFSASKIDLGASISAELVNNTGVPIKAQGIIAVFKNGRFVHFEFKPIELNIGQRKVFSDSISFAATENDYLVKMFVWSYMSEMVPISDVETVRF